MYEQDPPKKIVVTFYGCDAPGHMTIEGFGSWGMEDLLENKEIMMKGSILMRNFPHVNKINVLGLGEKERAEVLAILHERHTFEEGALDETQSQASSLIVTYDYGLRYFSLRIDGYNANEISHMIGDNAHIRRNLCFMNSIALSNIGERDIVDVLVDLIAASEETNLDFYKMDPFLSFSLSGLSDASQSKAIEYLTKTNEGRPRHISFNSRLSDEAKQKAYANAKFFKLKPDTSWDFLNQFIVSDEAPKNSLGIATSETSQWFIRKSSQPFSSEQVRLITIIRKDPDKERGALAIRCFLSRNKMTCLSATLRLESGWSNEEKENAFFKFLEEKQELKREDIILPTGVKRKLGVT